MALSATSSEIFRTRPGDGRLAASLAGMNDKEAQEMLGGLLEWTGAGSLGQRQPQEVVDRLLQKFRGSDEPRSGESGPQS